jgi:hypothetical protein
VAQRLLQAHQKRLPVRVIFKDFPPLDFPRHAPRISPRRTSVKYLCIRIV